MISDGCHNKTAVECSSINYGVVIEQLINMAYSINQGFYLLWMFFSFTVVHGKSTKIEIQL